MDGFEAKTYQLPSGGRITVDEDMHRVANDLANRFYVCHNYKSRPDFDFSASPHPQEQRMYLMALECLDYVSEYGIEC